MEGSCSKLRFGLSRWQDAIREKATSPFTRDNQATSSISALSFLRAFCAVTTFCLAPACTKIFGPLREFFELASNRTLFFGQFASDKGNLGVSFWIYDLKQPKYRHAALFGFYFMPIMPLLCSNSGWHGGPSPARVAISLAGAGGVRGTYGLFGRECDTERAWNARSSRA